MRAIEPPVRVMMTVNTDRKKVLQIATLTPVRAMRAAAFLMPHFSQDKEKTALNHIVNRSLTLSGEKGFNRPVKRFRLLGVGEVTGSGDDLQA